MYSLQIKNKVLIESQDFMEIVEFILTNLEYWNLSDKQARRLFYDLTKSGKHKLSNGSTIELRELLF
jgi:hypothetical protein